MLYSRPSYIIVYMRQSQSPNPSHTTLLGVHRFVLYVLYLSCIQPLASFLPPTPPTPCPSLILVLKEGHIPAASGYWLFFHQPFLYYTYEFEFIFVYVCFHALKWHRHHPGYYLFIALTQPPCVFEWISVLRNLKKRVHNDFTFPDTMYCRLLLCWVD